MTQAQKAAKEKFKKAIAYRTKTGVSLKEAFAHIYGKKKSAPKKKAASKKVAAIKIIEKGESKSAKPKSIYQQVRSKKGTFKGLKKVGAAKIKYPQLKISKGQSAYLVESNPNVEYDIYAIYTKGDYDKKIKVKKLPNKKYEYHNKIGASPKKSASKRITDIHKDSKSHNVNIKVVSGLHTIGEIEPSDFTRISNDVNGNPRYVIHFLQLLNDQERLMPFNEKYDYALKKAKKMGGRKFSNKQYGGGVVFQSYNIYDLAQKLEKLKSI